MGPGKRCCVVAVICLFLLLPLAGCLDDDPHVDDEPSGEVELGDIDTYSVEWQGEDVWTIALVITSEEFEDDDEARWEDMHIDLITDDQYFGFYLSEITGPIPVTFGAGYVPRTPGSEVVGEGDVIIIHGVDKDLEGVPLELFRDSDLLFAMEMPALVQAEVDVALDDPVMGSVIFPGSTSYTYEAEVTGIDPANATLTWWTLELRIESPTGDFAGLFGTPLEDPGVEGYDGETGPPEVEFWYIEDPLNGTGDPGTPTALDVGDGIKITGLSEKYEGANLTLLRGEEPVWNGTIPDMPEPDMTLELGSPTIHSVNRNETAFWNVTVPLSEVDPDDLMMWSSVWVKVKDGNGTDGLWSPLYGQDPGGYCSTVSAHYNEEGDRDYVISTGDDIVIKGLDLSYQAGLVEVFRGFTLLDSSTLPSPWPIADMWISTSHPSFTNRTVESVKYWDGSLNITRVDPGNIVLPWEDVEVRMVDRGTEEVLIPLTEPELWEWEHRTVPTIFYHEGGSPDGVDGKDIIVLSGLNLSFEGCYLEFHRDGEMIGEEWLGGPFDPAPTWLTLASPTVSTYFFNDTPDYRVILNINRLTPKTAKVPWSSITVEIENSTGAILVAEGPVTADSGVYDEDPSDGLDIALWYIDVSSDSWVSAGDAFKFTGIPLDAEGGRVNIYADGHIIGTIRLPTEFP